jgi:hypothetical protein
VQLPSRSSDNCQIHAPLRDRSEAVEAVKKLSKFQYENTFLRVHGQPYKGIKKVNGKSVDIVERNGRDIGEACGDNARCRKENSSLKCTKISNDERLRVHKMFWSLESWKDKRQFVKTLVEMEPPSRPRLEADKPRESSFRFFLLDNAGKRLRVCCTLFCSTLSMSHPTILRWVKGQEKSRESVGVDGDEENEHDVEPPKKRRQKEMERISDARNFLLSLPRMEAHYVRQEDSRMYLEPNWQSVREFHR